MVLGGGRFRHRWWLVALVVASAVASGAPSVVAIAHPRRTPTDPTLELSPDGGPGGSGVTVSGDGWTPGEVDLVATWSGRDGRLPSKLSIDDDGTLSGTIMIPDDAAVETLGIVEVCAHHTTTSAECQTAAFWVARTLALNPASGRRRATVDLVGRMEGLGQPVDATVTWQPGDIAVGTVAVAPDGTVSGRVTVPAEAAVGEAAIAVCIPDADIARCVYATFEVLPPIIETTITVAPTTPAVTTAGGGGSRRSPSTFIGATVAAVAAAVALWVAWRRRRARGRRRPALVGRLVARPDRGRPIAGRDRGPVVTVAAVLDLHGGTTTLKEER